MFILSVLIFFSAFILAHSCPMAAMRLEPSAHVQENIFKMNKIGDQLTELYTCTLEGHLEIRTPDLNERLKFIWEQTGPGSGRCSLTQGIFGLSIAELTFNEEGIKLDLWSGESITARTYSELFSQEKVPEFPMQYLLACLLGVVPSAYECGAYQPLWEQNGLLRGCQIMGGNKQWGVYYDPQERERQGQETSWGLFNPELDSEDRQSLPCIRQLEGYPKHLHITDHEAYEIDLYVHKRALNPQSELARGFRFQMIDAPPKEIVPASPADSN